MLESRPVMPNQRARGKAQVSAWVPETQAAILKAAAAALGVPLSDVVARLVARFGPEILAEMRAEASAALDARRVARTTGETTKGTQC